MHGPHQTIGIGERSVENEMAHFGQFEEFSEAFRDAGWGAEYTQLEAGRFHGQMLSTELGSAQISRCIWGKKVRHLGLPPKGTTALGVTLSQKGGRGRYLGQTFGLDDIIINADDNELEIIAAPTWNAAALVIPEQEICDQLETLTRREARSIVRSRSLATLTRDQGARLRRACHIYFRAVEGQLEANDPELPLESMAADLTALAISMIAEARIERLPKPGYSRRLEIFRRAEEYVRSCQYEALRVPDICRHIGTSERSLRYAFTELAGTSPAAYLKAQRLSRAHASLLDQDSSETQVKTVAYQYGFWHLGQFSKDYHQLFGELPSMTLAKA